MNTDLPYRGRLAMSAAGIVGTLLFFSLMFLPNLPMYGDSMVEYGRWASAHQADAEREVGLLLLTYTMYLIFGIYVATVVRSRAPWSVLMSRIGLVAIAVKFAIELMQVSVLSVGTSKDGSDFGGSMSVLGAHLSVLSLVPYVVFLAAVGAAAMDSRAFPAWLVWLTFAVAGVHALAMTMAVTGPPPVGPGLVGFGFVWFTSIPGWPLIAGMTLLVSAVRSQSAATRLAAAASAA